MKLTNFSDENLTFEIKDNDATIILHKAEYKTLELANLISWIHQIGVNKPELQLKIGAKIKQCTEKEILQ